MYSEIWNDKFQHIHSMFEVAHMGTCTYEMLHYTNLFYIFYSLCLDGTTNSKQDSSLAHHTYPAKINDPEESFVSHDTLAEEVIMVIKTY